MKIFQKITIITLLIAFSCIYSAQVFAGCYSQITQCVHTTDKGESIHYNGLCISVSCGNIHETFNYLEFPDGKTVRVNYSKDGKELEKPETNGIPSTSFISGASLWAVRTNDGEVYIALPCEDKCALIDPDTYNKLKNKL